MRKVIVILGLVALLAIPAQVSAAKRWTPAEPAVIAAVQGSCESPSGSNFFTGQHVSGGGFGGVSGAKSITYVYPDGFDICDTHPFDTLGNGPSTWVSVQLLNSGECPAADDGDCIIQIGTIECANSSNPVCQGRGNPRHFWATAGCNGAWPKPWDLGPAGNTWHEYTIYRTLHNGAPHWKFLIDGNTKALIAETNSRFSCWIGKQKIAGFFGERWDRGDSLGDPTQPLYLTEARYGQWNQGWFSPGWTAGNNCQARQPDDVCYFYGPDRMTMYETN